MMRKLPLFLCVSVLTLLFSCQKEITGKKNELDIDAQKFLDSARIESQEVRKAVSQLVLDLKQGSLWDKFYAIYPFVGGTAHSIKWNLKNPQDTDEAFRLEIFGNPVIGNSGVLFPTKEDFGDTHVNDSILVASDNHVSYYSRTQNTVDGYDLGCYDHKAPYNQMAIYHTKNATAYFGFYKNRTRPENTKGFFMLSSTPNNIIWYTNGVQQFEKGSAAATGFTGYNFIVGKCPSDKEKTGGQRECAFATVGKGLDAAQAENFYRIVQAFQTRLNRQVE